MIHHSCSTCTCENTHFSLWWEISHSLCVQRCLRLNHAKCWVMHGVACEKLTFLHVKCHAIKSFPSPLEVKNNNFSSLWGFLDPDMSREVAPHIIKKSAKCVQLKFDAPWEDHVTTSCHILKHECFGMNFHIWNFLTLPTLPKPQQKQKQSLFSRFSCKILKSLFFKIHSLLVICSSSFTSLKNDVFQLLQACLGPHG